MSKQAFAKGWDFAKGWEAKQAKEQLFKVDRSVKAMSYGHELGLVLRHMIQWTAPLSPEEREVPLQLALWHRILRTRTELAEAHGHWRQEPALDTLEAVLNELQDSPSRLQARMEEVHQLCVARAQFNSELCGLKRVPQLRLEAVGRP